MFVPEPWARNATHGAPQPCPILLPQYGAFNVKSHHGPLSLVWSGCVKGYSATKKTTRIADEAIRYGIHNLPLVTTILAEAVPVKGKGITSRY
jgi:hypothetical protein